MKFLMAAIALASSFAVASSAVKYPDSEWADFSPKLKERFLKTRSLIDTKKICEVAVYGGAKVFLKNFLPETVDCIADMLVNEGTVTEKTGCALVTYNVTNAQVIFGRRTPSQPVASKLCANGGFEELMQLKGGWPSDGLPAPTIEETLFSFSPSVYSYVLVYASGEKYLNWYSGARKKGAEAVAKRIKNQDEKKRAAEEEQLKAESKENAREAALKKNANEKKKTKEALWK